MDTIVRYTVVASSISKWCFYLEIMLSPDCWPATPHANGQSVKRSLARMRSADLFDVTDRGKINRQMCCSRASFIGMQNTAD